MDHVITASGSRSKSRFAGEMALACSPQMDVCLFVYGGHMATLEKSFAGYFIDKAVDLSNRDVQEDCASLEIA